MFRSSLPYGRKGLPIMAISGVDVALWDIVGKATGQPVWKLLGGATKDSIPVYSTGNDVAFYKELGFTGFKLAMPHGPVDGWAGMKANVDLIEQHPRDRRAGREIMLDCYMAWNVDYTLRMTRACRAAIGFAGSRNRCRRTTSTATPRSPPSRTCRSRPASTSTPAGAIAS